MTTHELNRLRALRNRIRKIEASIEGLHDELATIEAQLDELQYPKKYPKEGEVQ